jgi:hypothetical protein
MSPIVIVFMVGSLVRCKAVSPSTTVLNGRGCTGVKATLEGTCELNITKSAKSRYCQVDMGRSS